METLLQRISARPLWQRWALMLVSIAVFSLCMGLSFVTHSIWARLGLIVIMVLYTPVMALLGRTIGCEVNDPIRNEDRRYIREISVAMGIYLVVMVLVWPMLKQADSAALKVLIALSPMLPLALMMRAMVRYILGCDEFMQRLNLQALSIASAVVGFVSLAAGFLAAAKVVTLDGTALILVFPGLCMSYGVVMAWAKRRYR